MQIIQIRRLKLANEILNSLLKEYEQKKIREEIVAENRKEELYNKIPRLRKLDDEINFSAISTTMDILNKKILLSHHFLIKYIL